ncbi:MAG: efflux RND transporter periplasmic adaptor subunit [Gemmatimonadota bacterium]
MNIPRRRLLFFGGGGLLGLTALLIFVGTSAGGVDSELTAHVTRGEFKVVVTTTGELRARKFVQIQGPTNAQQAQQYQMRISSLVPEGTVVKTGDVVGELDRSGIASKVQEVALALQKADAQYAQAQLDSTLTLAQAREDIRNLEYALEEKQIIKDQSTYEAPSVKRQAEIDLDKAKRAFEQAKANYTTKKRQAEAKMREVGSDVERQSNLLKIVQAVMNGFTIRAPAPGMVIYVKEWNGQKKTTGSQINPWDPTVATLPDLSQMESVTYVNEIDVRKIAVNQSVDITLDSDPNKKLTGKVVQVANVGEQRPNADAKVFEVKIEVQQVDTTLRPGMTTGNAVLTSTVKNVLHIPLEAVAIEGDLTFVYRRSGRRIVRQQIVTGTMNEDQIIVLHGLDENAEVLLTPPAEPETLSLTRLAPELLPAKDTSKAKPDSAAAKVP